MYVLCYLTSILTPFRNGVNYKQNIRIYKRKAYIETKIIVLFLIIVGALILYIISLKKGSSKLLYFHLLHIYIHRKGKYIFLINSPCQLFHREIYFAPLLYIYIYALFFFTYEDLL